MAILGLHQLSLTRLSVELSDSCSESKIRTAFTTRSTEMLCPPARSGSGRSGAQGASRQAHGMGGCSTLRPTRRQYVGRSALAVYAPLNLQLVRRCGRIVSTQTSSER